ncbi:uncharacterized protein LOC126902512 isoform X1 [Daktulosphaira vitifoliae]|uniref:uncharacterized protein LOC126902512 isoform X1 n=1 Tax=Daktulosphaira vitifoliae TaxID=58002 RepID=UPI0021AADFA5|nr:uncharacterized protein LOC126902512 isoform X1 [Daktulosphaira vitifoliae]XP_050535832.1 uncharacterized protein LOC126902512 isoform X1 [Daktulosphaira vitifoliae]
MIIKKIVLFLHINLTFGLSYNDIHCNFIKYMLNFFNHNNRYLTEISENIVNYNVHNLKKYGNIIKSHGEIVLVMLDVIRGTHKNLYSTQLTSVNLYLNNVSKYVDFYAKNNDGIFDMSNQTSSILKGYILFHNFYLAQFERTIQKYCNNVIYDEVFIYCPDYNESGEYTLENFQYVANKLKNRLLQTDKLQNDTDDNINNLNHSEVYKVFNKAFKRSQYWEFLPKNLIFYDFMMKNPKISEKDLIRSSQDKQYPILINGRYKNVLDMIRFAPLTIKCHDKSHLRLFDIFRFVKYTFHRKEIEVFLTLLLTATFRPIALLVNFFIAVLGKITHEYNFKHNQQELLKYYENIISVGKRIIDCFNNFVNLNLFGDNPKQVFSEFLNKTIHCYNIFIHKWNYDLVYFCDDLQNALKLFLYNNKFRINILTEYFTNDINDNLMNALVVNLEQSEEFVAELKKHNKFFKINKKSFNFNCTLNNEYTYVLNGHIIDTLCGTKDIYTKLYKLNGDTATQIGDVKEKSNADDNENENKIIMEHQNHPNKNFKNKYRRSIYSPKYIIDYILFI